MKLEQGQIWRKGDDYFRIVEWQRLAIQYKQLKNPFSGEGSMFYATKKEFCRLLKGAVLLSAEMLELEQANFPDVIPPDVEE